MGCFACLTICYAVILRLHNTVIDTSVTCFLSSKFQAPVFYTYCLEDGHEDLLRMLVQHLRVLNELRVLSSTGSTDCLCFLSGADRISIFNLGRCFSTCGYDRLWGREQFRVVCRENTQCPS